MDYLIARPNIKSGDVIAFRGHGLFCWAIRAVTRSQWSHVALAWVVGERVLLIESRASRMGVTIDRPLSTAGACTWIPTGAAWGVWPESVALDALGIAYGWLDVFRAAGGLSPRNRGLHCAEYVADVLAAAGVKWPDDWCPTPAGVVARFPVGIKMEP